jgi:hypothetical protein
VAAAVLLLLLLLLAPGAAARSQKPFFNAAELAVLNADSDSDASRVDCVALYKRTQPTDLFPGEGAIRASFHLVRQLRIAAARACLEQVFDEARTGALSGRPIGIAVRLYDSLSHVGDRVPRYSVQPTGYVTDPYKVPEDLAQGREQELVMFIRLDITGPYAKSGLETTEALHRRFHARGLRIVQVASGDAEQYGPFGLALPRAFEYPVVLHDKMALVMTETAEQVAAAALDDDGSAAMDDEDDEDDEQKPPVKTLAEKQAALDAQLAQGTSVIMVHRGVVVACSHLGVMDDDMVDTLLRKYVGPQQ